LNKILVVNFDNCTGCQACVLACSMVKEGVFNPRRSRIWISRDEARGMAVPALCERCEEQPCVEACPVDAISKDPKLDIMIVNSETCDSCGSCVDSCPWEGIRLHPETNIAMICDLCDGTPVCAEICVPMKAVQYLEAEQSTIKKEQEYAERRTKILAALAKMEVV
jgi:carbon-monoxide dehydrogenase iron sulfur subunit